MKRRQIHRAVFVVLADGASKLHGQRLRIDVWIDVWMKNF